jgi:protease I
VVTDQNLTSSRWPDDLPAFCERIVQEFSTGARSGLATTDAT